MNARIFSNSDLKRLRRAGDIIAAILATEDGASSANGASAPKPRRKYKRRSRPKAERAVRRKATPRYRRDEAPVPEPVDINGNEVTV